MSAVALILFAVFISMLLSTSGAARRMSEGILRQALHAQPHKPELQQRGGEWRNPGEAPAPNARVSVLVAQINANGGISLLSNQFHFIDGAQTVSIVQTAMDTAGSMGILTEYGLRWLKSKDGARIAFADISMEQEMLRNLIINTLPIGSAALVVFFLISLLLARWAVRPVERAWERQRQFVANASHELKTPLTVILSNADMLSGDGTFSDERKARRMEHIREEAVRMKKLVEATADESNRYALAQPFPSRFGMTPYLIAECGGEDFLFHKFDSAFCRILVYTYRIQKNRRVTKTARRKELKRMRISISGKGIDVSDYLRELINKKVSKLERYFPKDTEVQVTMAVEKNRHIVEVTIPYDNVIIRGEEVTGDMYASIDNVLDKLEKQINRHRTRLEKSLKTNTMKYEVLPSITVDDDEGEGPRIVRVKRFSIKPMDEEEAMMQLDLLGHSFYMFENAETGDMNVLYKRRDGNFGLIEPE